MTVETPLFRLDLPEGWRWLPDEEGGAAVPPGDPGALVFFAQPVEDVEQLPSLRRMLSGFLTERGQPVSTFQLHSVKLGTFQGFAWQYAEDSHAWTLWITGNRKAWLLVSYNCPGEFLTSHWTEIQDILATVELPAEDPGPPG